MAGRLFVLPMADPAEDRNGRRLPHALLYFLVDGTNDTPATVYTDLALTVPHSWPIEADASGQYPAVYAEEGTFYTIAMTTSAGVPYGARVVEGVSPAGTWSDVTVRSLAVGDTWGSYTGNYILFGGGGANEGGYGVAAGTDGGSNWFWLRSTKPYAPTEVAVYSNAATGYATSTNGSNTITRNAGTVFDSDWIDEDGFSFGETRYLVTAVAGNVITVKNLDGSPVVFGSAYQECYHFQQTTTDGLCSTNGVDVTWDEGQPFIIFNSTIEINGTDYPVSSVDEGGLSLTLGSSAGVQNSVPFRQKTNINNQLSTFRVTKVTGQESGGSEENIATWADFEGFKTAILYGGLGLYRDWAIYCGTVGSPTYSLQPLMQFRPGDNGDPTMGGHGYVCLGGVDTGSALNAHFNPNTINWFEAYGGPTGLYPSFRARGLNTNVGIDFDTQAAGEVVFTSRNFAATQAIIGDGGAATNDSYPVLHGSNSATAIYGAGGSATNVVSWLQGKGSAGGELVDGAGTRRVRTSTTGVGFQGTAPIAKPTLAAVATDAATTLALANSIRTALINYGLAA